MRISLTWAATSILCALSILEFVPRSEAMSLDVEIEIDLGEDLGQNFGTLFEGRNGSGRLIVVGFPAVFNTYYRSERRNLHFFVRPQEGKDGYTLEPFPRPNNVPSTYVYDLGNELYVHHKTKIDGQLKYHPQSKSWEIAEGDDRHGVSASTVRGKRLEYLNGDVVYDAQVVFDPPDHPIYRYYYYGQGHLFFYRETMPENGDSKKAVVAIPWSPYENAVQADITDEVVLEIFYPPEFPYAWGQIGEEVLTCSNMGGLYAFNGTDWKIWRKPIKNVSYQVYTMVTYGERLLMGQYPTGFFISYDGQEVKVLDSWPPVPQAASPSARELQTAAIYRGELFAGVWPWGELWRFDPDSNNWKAMGRLFKHPKVHPKPVHPYEEEAKSIGIVLNQLGQRLTSMVPEGDGLIMGTSWKGGESLLDPEKFGILSQGQREEFGALHRLQMPGALTAVMEWKERPTKLRFMLKDGQMSIYQDNKELASVSIEKGLLEDADQPPIQWGNGVFGPFTGEILSKP